MAGDPRSDESTANSLSSFGETPAINFRLEMNRFLVGADLPRRQSLTNSELNLSLAPPLQRRNYPEMDLNLPADGLTFSSNSIGSRISSGLDWEDDPRTAENPGLHDFLGSAPIANSSPNPTRPENASSHVYLSSLGQKSDWEDDPQTAENPGLHDFLQSAPIANSSSNPTRPENASSHVYLSSLGQKSDNREFLDLGPNTSSVRSHGKTSAQAAVKKRNPSWEQKRRRGPENVEDAKDKRIKQLEKEEEAKDERIKQLEKQLEMYRARDKLKAPMS